MIKDRIIEKYGKSTYTKLIFFIKGVMIAAFLYYISDYALIRVITAESVKEGLTYLNIEKSVIIYQNYIAVGRYEISKMCVGVASSSIFTALFVLSSLPLVKKISFLSIFLLVLFLLNIFRIIITIYLYEQGYSWFIAHDILAYGLGIGYSFFILIKINPYIPLFR